MSDEFTPEFSPDSPLLVGEDDGSPARLVLCQAYWGTPGHTWVKGALAWVAGADVDWAIERRFIAPVVAPAAQPAAHRRPPTPTAAAAEKSGWAPPLAAVAAEASVSAIQEPEPPVEAGGTYDLDDAIEPEPDPTPAPTRPRPRRTSAA